MAEATELGTPVHVPSSALELPARSPFELFWRRFRQDRLALGSLIFIGLIVVVAIAAPLIVDIAGTSGPNVRDTNALDAFGTPLGPSSAHPFGVDQLGRDVFSRTIYGARVSLIVAFLATGLAMIVGVIAGLLAGYLRGWVDVLVSRSVDVLLAIPYLLLATGLAASCSLGDGCFGGALKPGLGVVIFVISVTSWPPIARIVRGEALSLREREFVEAARSVGASNTRIVFTEVLPNLVAPIIVYASILIPQVILYEAALSFLGVGVEPPTASWGQMLSDATGIFDTAWWYMLFPGLALLFTVLAFNLVGDALQDALNPKASRK
ncbi:MAG: ABC transporter permease [Actinomycetota bacterium]